MHDCRRTIPAPTALLLQMALSDLPLIELGAPMSNYALLFLRSGGAYATVLAATGMRDGDLYQLLQDWTLLLHGLDLVVQAVDAWAGSGAFRAAVAHLAATFARLFRDMVA
jgi:hypothetical protein